jgi:hypothetical protein
MSRTWPAGWKIYLLCRTYRAASSSSIRNKLPEWLRMLKPKVLGKRERTQKSLAKFYKHEKLGVVAAGQCQAFFHTGRSQWIIERLKADSAIKCP